jgi:hypothetical protein
MDKVFSARINEAVLRELGVATERLGITKKAFLEKAIRLAAANLGRAANDEIWESAFGAWQREESTRETVARAKGAFRKAATRHHEGARANLSR